MIQISPAVYREVSPIEDLLIETGVDIENNLPVLFHQNDLYLLFNQERLEALGADTIMKYIESLQPQSDGLSILRAKCTDEQLISLVKSRHIQSRNELLLWSKYLDHSADELQKSIIEAEKSVSTGDNIKSSDNESKVSE